MQKPGKHSIFRNFVAVSLVAAFCYILSPFVVPILLGIIFAFALEPLVAKVSRKKILGRPAFARAFMGVSFIAILGILTAALLYTYSEISRLAKMGAENPFFQNLNRFKTLGLKHADRIFERFEIVGVNSAELSDRALEKIQAVIGNILNGAVTAIPAGFIFLFIFCVALYFFIMYGQAIREKIIEYDLLPKAELDEFIFAVKRSSYSTVVSSIAIAIIQSLVVALGSFIFHTGSPIIIFVVTFFLSFIPIIGASPVAFALAIWCLALSRSGDALGLAAVGIFAGSIDNIIRPFLISNADKELHPLVMLVAIFGALVVWGFPGLFLGPVVAIMAIKELPVFINQSRFKNRPIDIKNHKPKNGSSKKSS